MDKRLTTKELACLHGVSDRVIRKWVSAGLHHRSRAKVNGGKPLWTFDNALDVLPFLANRGITTKYIEDRIEKAAVAAPAGPGNPSTTIDMALAKEPGILGSLERLKMQEVSSASLLLHLKRTKASAAEISSIQRMYIKDVATLHKGELAALEVQSKRGRLVDLGGVSRHWSRLATATKDSVLSIPHKALPALRPFLSRADAAAEVENIIVTACNDALRHLRSYEP